MFTLWSDMDRLLNNSLANWMDEPRFLTRYPRETGSAERMNLIDKGDTLEFVAELPGVEEKDLKLTVHDDTLTLSAKRSIVHNKEDKLFLAERCNYDIQRSIALPSRVEAEKAEASFKNGVLRVELPRSPESKPRQIAINA